MNTNWLCATCGHDSDKIRHYGQDHYEWCWWHPTQIEKRKRSK